MTNKILYDGDHWIDTVRSFYIGIPSPQVHYLLLPMYVHHLREAIGCWEVVAIVANVYDDCDDYDYDGGKG